MSTDTSRNSIKVLAKSVALLDLLQRSEALAAADIAATLGEPRPTVYRLLATLSELGLIQPATRPGTYELGMRLYRYGAVVERRFNDVRAAALPAMERLHAETQQTVFLTVRRGHQAVCIARIDGIQVGVMVLPVGGSIPLHGGAHARALLAFEPEHVWRDFAESGPLEAFTNRTEVSPSGLYDQLTTVAAAGYSISDEDVIPGIASIGAPVFGAQHRLVAAISLSGPSPMVLGDRREHNIEAVLETAAEISKRLGSDPASPA